mgnify:CR=1 FL=1
MTTTINNEHKKLNVPNLRFPEFQGEWEKCILGDITENFNLRNKDKIQYPMFSVTNDRGLSLNLNNLKAEIWSVKTLKHIK